MDNLDLLIIGNPASFHLGAHYFRASNDLGLKAKIIDINLAYSKYRWINRLVWHFDKHSAPLKKSFSEHVYKIAKIERPKLILVLGIAPIHLSVLKRLHSIPETRIVNFLSDDPFNPTHYAKWFLDSLSEYDLLYTPRHANVGELQKTNPKGVRYLKFGYCPHVHYPGPALTSDETQKYECDLMFAGGADSDRLPYVKALIYAGLRVKLYGGYWERDKETRPFAMGNVGLDELRKAVSGAKLCLNLVRKANRDDHVMRSFELPAMGAAILSEDTIEHRKIYGNDAVIYFSSLHEMLEKTREYLSNKKIPPLGERVLEHIRSGNHTYADRLKRILEGAK